MFLTPTRTKPVAWQLLDICPERPYRFGTRPYIGKGADNGADRHVGGAACGVPTLVTEDAQGGIGAFVTTRVRWGPGGHDAAA